MKYFNIAALVILGVLFPKVLGIIILIYAFLFSLALMFMYTIGGGIGIIDNK